MGPVLLVNLAANLFMVGLIRFVQVVDYPLLARVGAGGFAAYAGIHSRLTGLVVDPPILAEAATSIVLVVGPPPGISPCLPAVGLALLAAIWLALLQPPRHHELGGGFDASAHRSLVLSDWLRTACWSARALVVLWMAAQAAG